MERNFKKVEEKEEIYLGSKIVAWCDKWEEYNADKDKWEKKSKIYCHLYRVGSKNQPLNLGECNDGSKFTAVNQAVNQAKDFVNCCNQHNW
jgi:hypothetical protein